MIKEQKKKEEQKHTSQNVNIFLKHQHHTDPHHFKKNVREQSNTYPKKTKQILFYCIFIIESIIKPTNSANFVLLLNLLVVSLHLLSILLLTSQQCSFQF